MVFSHFAVALSGGTKPVSSPPNGGLAIDTWHMAKLGIEPEELRRVPLEQLAWIELSDGFVEDMEDPVDETINHRRLPGEGEFDVRAYVETACDHGYPGPWGVAVPPQLLIPPPQEQEVVHEVQRGVHTAASLQHVVEPSVNGHHTGREHPGKVNRAPHPPGPPLPPRGEGGAREQGDEVPCQAWISCSFSPSPQGRRGGRGVRGPQRKLCSGAGKVPSRTSRQ